MNVFYVGADISKALLTFARGSIHGHFMQADIQSLPFKSQSFDIVMSLGVLHHVPNYLKGCTEALRVLKDEAVFLLREPSKSVGRIEVSPHERGISEEKILRICKAYGKLLERKTIHTRFLRRPFRLLAKLFHRSPIIFIARAKIEFVLD
ncbi:MAG: class I SAM-dependent methyltransferase [Candidatus Bathyarchaeia archaeon]